MGKRKKENWTPSIDHTHKVHKRPKPGGSFPDRTGDHLHATREKSREEVLNKDVKEHEDERETITNLMTLKLRCQKTPHKESRRTSFKVERHLQ